MKKIAIVVSFLSISFIGAAQLNVANPTPVAGMAADMLGLKEDTFDFGKIPQGKPVTHVFAVENTGADSLRINNIQASCGCTTPEWEREKVQAPGEKTTITVGYNAAAEGPFTKVITVSYNGTHTKQITIKGEVWKTPASSAPENTALKSLSEE